MNKKDWARMAFRSSKTKTTGDNNTKAHWPMKQLNDLQDFWEDIMWTDETKAEGFHLIPSGMKLTQHFIPTVKRDGSVMVCA